MTEVVVVVGLLWLMIAGVQAEARTEGVKVVPVVVVVHVWLVEEVGLELVKMVELRRVVELGRMIMVMLVAVIQLGHLMGVVVGVVKSKVSRGEGVRDSMYCTAVLCICCCCCCCCCF